MQTAIEENYFDGYFEKEREEVFMTTLFEVDRDIYENDLKEDYMEKVKKMINKKIIDYVPATPGI